MEKERWKPIVGYEGIAEVSDHGRVRTLDRRVGHMRGSQLKRGQMLTASPDEEGYLRVSLCWVGKKRAQRVHRLVAQHFIDNPANAPEVNHRDLDKANNHHSNLEWCTRQENSDHAKRAGRFDSAKMGRAKLTHEQVAQIRASKLGAVALSLSFGVSDDTVRDIRSRHTWRSD